MKCLLLCTLTVVTAAPYQAFAMEAAPSTVHAKYIEPSTSKTLVAGEKIGNLFQLNSTQPYILQRLTDKTYFFQRQNYGTTFYVGKSGVLLFDPLGGHGEFILKAIKEITPLPVTAMVYSHNHADHIGDANVIAEASKKAGIKLRIIATEKTASKMEFTNAPFPRPTERVSWPNGKLKFENLEINIHGFERAAHTDDHSAWLLVNEKILHLPDLINPDQPPFWRFAGSENFLYYEQDIKEVAALSWNILNGGHGNIGSRDDLEFYKMFLSDLKNEVGKAMADTPFGSGVDPDKINSHTAFLSTWTQILGKKTTDAMRPKYGKYYGFEYATPANVEMVAMSMMSYPNGK